MKRFRLINGNRLELLSEALSRMLKAPAGPPLEPEVFIVQSHGMATWLSMEIARHLGISANLKFFSPNHFLRFAFERILPDFIESPLDEPGIVTWQLMRMLPQIKEEPVFAKIRTYLEDDEDGVKCFQVAARLADTLDQYLVFRPEMILEWEAGQDAGWQAELWRRLVTEIQTPHRAGHLQQLSRQCLQEQVFPDDFPGRISVFGISALPHFHMQLFDVLSHFIEVNLFLLNPCREYWGDILSDREAAGRRAAVDSPPAGPADLYLEQGNSLLAATGTMGRDFFDTIHSFGCEDIDIFESPGRDSLLHRIQRDILNLTEGAREESPAPVLSPDDHSVAVQSCHSPMREVEILHNHLLSCFERYGNLTPNDILVMTPDIETYAPYIEAVFDLPADDPKRMPYRIADRSLYNESLPIQAFFAILDLQGGRFRLSEVMNILEFPDIQSTFEFTTADLACIRSWAAETRIHWGIDADFRKQLGLPEYHEHTWQAGMERLLLGYAMEGESDQLFQGILPFRPIEGGQAETLGRFIQFVSALFRYVRSFDRDRTVPDWTSHLASLLDVFFQPGGPPDGEIQPLREVIGEMNQHAHLAGFNRPVSFAVIRKYLSGMLQKKGFGTGFISGGITFSAMLPMRSIPFRIICLLGMNHDAYPRQPRTVEFDLIARHPRPGDRSRRNDDQYLFLETILSARDLFYISYIGRSIQDNSPQPPSVLVSELMQYVEDNYRMHDRSIQDHILAEHRLQPFHPVYFDASPDNEHKDRFFSYSEADQIGAACLQSSRAHPPPFFNAPLPEPGSTDIEVAGLIHFFANPCRYIVNQRLGIYLQPEEHALEDRESFDLDGLDRYEVARYLVEQNIRKQEPQSVLRRVRASGILPPGPAGTLALERLQDRTAAFCRNLLPLIRDPIPEPLLIDVQLEGLNLRGRIDGLYSDHCLTYRFGIIHPRDLLKGWIYHLLINCLKPHGVPRTTMVAGLPPQSRANSDWSAVRFPVLEDASAPLITLLKWFQAGLRLPLQFFPRSSHRYAELMQDPDVTQAEAIRKIDPFLTGSELYPGELSERYCRFCFRNGPVLDESFHDIAVEVFHPMLACMERVH